VTGRFFNPRPSEEFYDTVTDFDNVNNLVDDPGHKAKIEELKQAMRQKQLELFDSGLLPENMRLRRAQDNGMTIYEMVRDPKLYPLEKYLNFSDVALSRNPAYLDRLVNAMKDPDEGIRYWATCGLFLLKDKARPAVKTLGNALADECTEVQMMAAWAMHRLGFESKAEATLAAVKKVARKDKAIFESIHRLMNATHPTKGGK
jgi:HEAT repeat protein